MKPKTPTTDDLCMALFVTMLGAFFLVLLCSGPTIDHEPEKYEWGPRMARRVGGVNP